MCITVGSAAAAKSAGRIQRAAVLPCAPSVPSAVAAQTSSSKRKWVKPWRTNPGKARQSVSRGAQARACDYFGLG